MDYPTCVALNVPLVALSLATVSFYIYCIACPVGSRGRVKQPLKVLLESLICSSLIYLVSLLAAMVRQLLGAARGLTEVTLAVSLVSLLGSIGSSVWLNFFYYTQIVPGRRPLFLWIKKNVKAVIYSIWVLERLYCLFAFVVVYLQTDGFSGNVTAARHIGPRDAFHPALRWMERVTAYTVFVVTLKAHAVLSLCIMTTSSGTTAAYLCGHMRRMVASGRHLSCLQLRGQVRVTTTGIIQGVLYLVYAAWTSRNFFSSHLMPVYGDVYAHFTVTNVYMSGTLLNLGAGQAVFWRRLAELWVRATTARSKRGG